MGKNDAFFMGREIAVRSIQLYGQILES